jgi:hypothetical protein
MTVSIKVSLFAGEGGVQDARTMHIGKTVNSLKRFNLQVRTLLILLSRRGLAAHSSARKPGFRLCYSLSMKFLAKSILAACLIGASAAQADKTDDDEPIVNEAEIRTVIQTETEFATDACMASIEVEYYQKGSSAHVETELNNDDCAASSGTYVIQVRYKDAAGEHQSKNFDESWERSDAEAIVAEKDYFVAEDIDILRVRSRKLNCTCATEEMNDGN